MFCHLVVVILSLVHYWVYICAFEQNKMRASTKPENNHKGSKLTINTLRATGRNIHITIDNHILVHH